jgi:phosphoglycolate phosphatase-like HAD superfamily hydrolase
MTVILFDIDGTLLSTGGAGRLAMETALRKTFGLDTIRDGLPYSGRTDRCIGYDLLRTHDLPVNEATWQQLQRAYLAELPFALRQRLVRILPGIDALLSTLTQRADVALGLLTGNLRAGAQVKLGHFGIDHLFPFGGFGDDHFDRDDVARLALADARRHLGRPVTGHDCWVIGDTPLDVRCARAIGARVLAVATGTHHADELAASGPDLLLENLADPEPLLRHLG